MGVFVVIFALVVGYTVLKLKGAERSRMLVAQVLIFFSVLFWRSRRPWRLNPLPTAFC